MEKLENDILCAHYIVKHNNDKFDKMTSYSRIYQNTTENLKQYMSFINDNFNSALLPTASGDHLLEAVLKSIDDITLYDINKLSKYFAKLKFEAIKNLNKQEYVLFMYKKMLDPEIFNYFKNNLDDETRFFWEELFKSFSSSQICQNLFRKLGFISHDKIINGNDYSQFCLCNYSNLLDHYYFIQEKLHTTNIKYIDGDIKDIVKTSKEKYDYINLTNIYEYINPDIFYGGDQIFRELILDLVEHLNDNGKIMIAYLYRCLLKDVKRYLNKPLKYADNIAKMQTNDTLRTILDTFFDIIDTRSLLDRLYAYRNIQALISLKDLPFKYYEVDNTKIGQGIGNKDMVLIYKKEYRNGKE